MQRLYINLMGAAYLTKFSKGYVEFTTALVLPATLIVTSRNVAQAYNELVLVKGVSYLSADSNCSFIHCPLSIVLYH